MYLLELQNELRGCREGRGSTEEANLGYLPQGGPLGRRNAIAFGIQVPSPFWREPQCWVKGSQKGA